MLLRLHAELDATLLLGLQGPESPRSCVAWQVRPCRCVRAHVGGMPVEVHHRIHGAHRTLQLGARGCRAQTRALMAEMGVSVSDEMLCPVSASDVYLRACANLVNQQYRQGTVPHPAVSYPSTGQCFCRVHVKTRSNTSL